MDKRKNVCEFNLETLQQCVDTASSNDMKNNNAAYNFIKIVCGDNASRQRVKEKRSNFYMSQEDKMEIENNWKKLFSKIIENKKQLKVVIMPEHKLFTYTGKPTNAVDAMNETFNQFIGNSKFKLIDYSYTHVDR